ncbi:MAG: hypothetical protein EBR82_22460 [Caulobacteraceae bacterium]|nr:hypothetical protein [Caulobacteraceae bacterium]
MTWKQNTRGDWMGFDEDGIQQYSIHERDGEVTVYSPSGSYLIKTMSVEAAKVWCEEDEGGIIWEASVSVRKLLLVAVFVAAAFVVAKVAGWL